ncbi:helix-turn-helix domain-containing protein [Paenibacillus taiwanensis]|uniref:helix-turn-helix domain-containing protein n=1 Tax=Paenibacillus taiwanensis TaxID=401638 RepID=UPI0003FEE6B3|nr:RodZ family helix-turn-helix domain-containing protein [Paenibacillus taiwanensis]
MSELGQLLKKARLEKGLSLDDVQEATKIRKRYLEAIEEGDYKILPGSFYVRAFVKTYAETVGLDPDEVAQYYRQDIPAAEPEPTIEPMIRKKRSVQHSDKFGKWATTLLMWSFVILIFVIVYYFWVKASDTGNNPNSADSNNITNGINQNEKPDSGNNTQGNGQTTTPEPTPEPEETKEPIVAQVNPALVVVSAADEKPFKLEIKIEDGVWLGVRTITNANQLAKDVFDKGQDQSFDLGKDGLDITFGNAARCKVLINGQAIDIGQGMNKKVRFEWKAYEEALQLKQGSSVSDDTGTAADTNNG